MEGLGRTVENETAFCHDLANRLETGSEQCLLLLSDRHVQGFILHASFTGKVIAREVDAARHKQCTSKCVELRRMALATELMYGLIGDNAFERAKIVGPVCFFEAAFNEHCAFGEFAKACFGKLMHCSREVEQRVLDLTEGAQKMLRKEPWTRAEFKYALDFGGGCCDLPGEAREELRPPRTLRHCRPLPLTSIMEKA